MKTMSVSLPKRGCRRFFLQFDGTEDRIYEQLRGRKLLVEKLAAIQNCAAQNIGVILVPTLVPSVNTGNIGSILHFARNRMPIVRGVHFQPVSYFGRYGELADSLERITIPEVLRLIEEQTGGAIQASDFSPPGCEHAYCSFHCNFIRMPDGRLKAADKEKIFAVPNPKPPPRGSKRPGGLSQLIGLLLQEKRQIGWRIGLKLQMSTNGIASCKIFG